MAVFAASVGVDFPALSTAVVVKTAVVGFIYVEVVLVIEVPGPAKVVFVIVDKIGDSVVRCGFAVINCGLLPLSLWSMFDG